ncbi:hypothetical protein PRIPAC_87802 [Pristionchus pacificus]|uniref:F-box domain-containing protein n=1 Tax=Pristionchus pacificus TaxID=54126 RepID=A0A2A6CWV3_PRIPA|nr:hypothetical protein PRIPAC_87802 [Pristionchus pacificus]|eukprot:PDM82714.1 hypothetical protein PRIPAC_37107 [Pristionchus pacificus]
MTPTPRYADLRSTPWPQRDEQFHILEQPKELIGEIFKHVDYDGLLALRKVSHLMKEIVDEVCCTLSTIQQLYFTERNVNDPYFKIDLGHSKPPIILLPWKHLTSPRFNRNVVYVNGTREEFPEFLRQFRDAILRAPIEEFTIDSRDEFYLSAFESFLQGLTVLRRSLDAFSHPTEYRINWNIALRTIRRLGLNAVEMGIYARVIRGVVCTEFAEIYQTAELADFLHLRKYIARPLPGLPALIVGIFQRSCSRVQFEKPLDEEDVNEIIKQLPSVQKDLHLHAFIIKGPARRILRRMRDNNEESCFNVGSMQVEIRIEPGAEHGILEMWRGARTRLSCGDIKSAIRGISY